MTRWQRRLRFGLAVFVVAVAAAVFFSVRRPPAGPPPPPAARAQDPNAVAEFARGTLTQAKGTSQEFELNYERLVTYKDGSSRLFGVSASVPDRGGRSFEIAGREASAAGDEGDVALRGDVQLQSSDGLVLRADEALYRAADGSVRIPGPARFTRGRLSGESIGLAYDRQADQVSLLKQVRLKAAPGAPGEETGTIEAASALLARRDGIVRFEGGTRIHRGGQVITADRALALLTEDGDAVEQLELRGGSNVTGAADSASGLEAMSARDIDLVYAEDGATLEQAILRGGSAVVLRGASKQARRRLEGETIDIVLGPDGATVVGLDARDRVRLDLPAEPDTPARVITADLLAATGPPDKGLTSASFRRNLTFVETPATKDAVPRRATASRLDLELEGGFDTIRSADFSGGTRFEQGSLAAISANARYDVTGGLLHLEPGGGRRPARPRVVDDQATIEADRIDVGLDGRRVDAKGRVQSDLKPRAGGDQAATGGQGAREAARLPSMMKQDEPVFGTSDALAYDGEAGRADYTGRARLWQGDTSVKGDRVTLDDRSGDLSASGTVASTMLFEQVNEETKQTEKVRSVATADALAYEEARRRARYTGQARLNGPQGDLTAPVIDIFLLEGGSQVERLEAYPDAAAGPAPASTAGTAVSIKTPDGRRATGARLVYRSDGERYEMVGAPVRIVEECRETTGKTLTFFRSADRIVVDGNEQTRTEVKGSSGCSAPRLD
jgi:lipopolysaccharide export system protein LptA